MRLAERGSRGEVDLPARDAHRKTVLVKELQRVGERFVSDFRLPLSPAMLVRGLDMEVRGSQCGNAWGGKGKRERSGLERARLYIYIQQNLWDCCKFYGV